MADQEIYGVRIYTDDFYVQDADIGLYAYSGAPLFNLSKQTNIHLSTFTGLYIGQKIKLLDSSSGNTEIVTIVNFYAPNNTIISDWLVNYPYLAATTTAVGYGEIRLIENAMDGLTLDWSSNLIMENGIHEIIESASLERGGAVVDLQPISLRINNTAKWSNEIESLGIGLGGLKAEIYSFSKNQLTGVVTESIIYRGKTELNQYNESEYVLDIVPATNDRNANILTQVNVGNKSVTIPATFGRFDDNKLAFVNVTDEKKVYEASLNLLGKRSTFPVFSVTDALNFDIRILGANEQPQSSNLGILMITINNFFSENDDVYVEIITGANNGQIRKVASHTVNGHFLELELVNPFTETLETSGAELSVCQLIAQSQEFKSDVWPCKSFLDLLGVTALSSVALFYYDEKYITLANYAYRVPDTNYNKIELDPELTTDSIESLSGFIVQPNFELSHYTEDYAGQFRDDYEDILGVFAGFYQLKSAGLGWWAPTSLGLYIDIDENVQKRIEGDTIFLDDPDINDALDKNATTGIRYTLSGFFNRNATADILVLHAFRLKLSKLDTDFPFSKVYLGVKLNITGSSSNNYKQSFYLTKKSWYSDASFVLEEAGLINVLSNSVPRRLSVSDIPRFYYEENRPDDDSGFYVENNTEVTDQDSTLTGYSLFDLGVSSVQEFNNLSELVLMSTFRFTSVVINDDITFDNDLYEVALIFETGTQNISKNVFGYGQGRIYNDTWGSRVTSTDMITKPRFLMEHFCRLQNFYEENETDKTAGLEYSDEALINTSSDQGGFSHPDILALDSYDPAFQVLNYADGWIDKLKDEWCRTYFCTSYINESGKECVSYLLSSQGIIADTITLDDILFPENQSGIMLVKLRNVTSEPFIKYNYDPGLQDFRDIIQVTNIIKGSFASGDVIGVDDTAGARLYDRCYDEIFKTYHSVGKPPSDMTNRYMISTQRDAIAYLDNLITWMTRKRIQVPIPYNFDGGSGVKAKNWHVGRHLNLNLPHETNGVNIECTIEKIRKIKNENKVIVQLILLDNLPVPFYLQEVFYTVAEGANYDWEETFDTNDDLYTEVL